MPENRDRPCQVCSHPSRSAIEQALMNGKGLRGICESFGIGSGTFGTDTFHADHKKLSRHRDDHMPEAYAAAREARAVESGVTIANALSYLEEVTQEAIERLRVGEIKTYEGVALLNDDGTPMRRWKDTPLLMAVAQQRANLELRHKMAGALSDDQGEGVDLARLALENPEARRAMAELDEILMQADRAKADQAAKGSGE
jgi:hypothetical protein